MRTPERAVWPLPPPPACLPLPEPMPRPTRMRGLDEPGLSLTSLSFMSGDPYRPSTTRSRCATLAIMPRLAGVSATLDRRPILLRPRPLSVSRCEPGRPIALAVCSSIMFLSAVIVLLSRIGGVGFDALAARLQRRHLEVAPLGDRTRTVFARQRVEGGAHHVVGVRRALALGDDIVHAKRLEDGAHGAARDNAGAGRRRTQHDAARAVAAVDVVMQRPAFAQRHTHDAALRGFGRLADGLRHLARLAMAEADASLLIADDDKRGEAEATPALHHLRHAIDMHEAIDKLAVALLAVPIAAAAAFSFTRHWLLPSVDHRGALLSAARFHCVPSKVQTALAGAIRQRFDAPVIHVAAPVEHHFINAGLLRPLGEFHADALCGLDRRAGLQRFAKCLFKRGGGRKSVAPLVVDDLSVDLLRGAKNAEPRATVRMSADRAAHARLASIRCGLGVSHAVASYFFLPSLRKINSPAYFTPFPL